MTFGQLRPDKLKEAEFSDELAPTRDALALGPFAVDFATEQGTSRSTAERAERAVAARIDRATDQCAANTADDQASGAIGAAAIHATVLTAPFLIDALCLGWSRREESRSDHGGRSKSKSKITHNEFPFDVFGYVTTSVCLGLHEPETTGVNGDVQVQSGAQCFVPDILVIHRQNHVDWGWSDSGKRDSFHLTAGVEGGVKARNKHRMPGPVTVVEPRRKSKAKRSDQCQGLTKGARRSGMTAKAIVTQTFESRDNRAMPLS